MEKITEMLSFAKDIITGGKLELEMGPQPSAWGKNNIVFFNDCHERYLIIAFSLMMLYVFAVRKTSGK